MDKHLKRPVKTALCGWGNKKDETERRCTHPPVALQARTTRPAHPRALARPTGARLNAREYRLSEGKSPLSPTLTPANLSRNSRFHFFFVFLWRLGVFAVRFLIMDLLRFLGVPRRESFLIILR